MLIRKPFGTAYVEIKKYQKEKFVISRSTENMSIKAPNENNYRVKFVGLGIS